MTGRPGAPHGADSRGWVQQETAHQTQVPQRQSHEGRELLSGQAVADDADEAEFAILLGEAILLGDPAEAGRAGFLEISATNEGRPVPADLQERLFTRSRHAGRTARGKRSTGPGLSIVSQCCPYRGGAWNQGVPFTQNAAWSSRGLGKQRPE